MKRERGFAAIGALISAIPMSVWVGLAFGLVLSFSIFQTHRLHKEQKAFTQFQADVKAAGKAAEDAAVKKAAEDKKQKEKTDAENKRTTDSLNHELVRMRANNATRSLVPAATATASRPDLACFDRAELDGALRAFTGGTLEISGECAKATVDLDSAKRWAQH
jgi:hypothetical protein